MYSKSKQKMCKDYLKPMKIGFAGLLSARMNNNGLEV